MDGTEMKRLRQDMGLDRLQFARMIGYSGTDRNDDFRIRSYEGNKKQIPLYIARLVWLIHQIRGYGPIEWPNWSGYDFYHLPDQPVNLED